MQGTGGVAITPALLLGYAPPDLLGPVLDRLDAATRRAVLAEPPLPAPVIVTHVAEHGTEAERLALATNPDATREVLGRLLPDASEAVARAVLAHQAADRGTMLRAYAIAPPDLARDDFAPPGPGIGEVERGQRALYPLAESADPDVLRHVLAHAMPGSRFPARRAVVLRACLNLWRAVGPREAAAALDASPQPEGREVDLLAGFEHPDGRQRLGRAIENEGRTPLVLKRIRELDDRSNSGEGARGGGAVARARIDLVLLAPHQPLAWDLVVDEHRLWRWQAPALSVFAHQPGCPPELTAHATPGGPGRARAIKNVRDDIGRSARSALRDDADAWLVAVRLVPEFTGTLRELLGVARAAAA
ncbi:hypothetical protein [Yinghuangia seranimata]|uniref:hypothetical protein n=1 Tax=Yinghuangia seranimata TaxID=408067 RepID=UPI00248C1009|nr:hypothetical protein [Yinghuangia seranimata]MDI2132724.1 hypothetical protein [Yinghuangia seranimata]